MTHDQPKDFSFSHILDVGDPPRHPFPLPAPSAAGWGSLKLALIGFVFSPRKPESFAINLSANSSYIHSPTWHIGFVFQIVLRQMPLFRIHSTSLKTFLDLSA